MKSKVLLPLACLAGLLTVHVGADRACAQEGQGKYITEATVRLIKQVDTANAAGFKLQDNTFSIGGGWLKKSTTTWIPLYTVQLNAGKDYRFLASGDADAKDVDLQVVDAKGAPVKTDADEAADARIDFRPTVSGLYTVRIRLYASEKDYPCVCLAIVMSK